MSENGTTQVDDWFREKEHPLETEMQRVRKIIRDADPRVEESIKWKTPTFSFNGNIVSFNPAKRFVSLLFHRGAEIPGEYPLLVGEGKLARTMRFADLDEIAEGQSELEAVVRAWCALKET